jgi:hypothetical protein
MDSAAVNFEYEWMADGSLRLRFLNKEDRILGQQLVAAEGILALQTIMGLASARASDVEPDQLMHVFRSLGFDVDLEAATTLKEAQRVRAGITPEGNVGLNTIADD